MAGRTPSIVLVALDTFRADRFGAHPGRASLTPRLDELAVRARHWPNATSTAALTMPSMASVMTGRYPDRVGIIGHGASDRLVPTNPTLASLAKRAGYRTIAIVTNPWLARRATGFSAGFDSFESGRTLGASGARLGAAAVTDAALAAVDARATPARQPLLLWAHYMDTHMPYQPPTDAAPPVTSKVIRDFGARGADRQRIYFEAPYDEVDLDRTRAMYDAAVSYVDREVGRLLDGLRERHLLDDAIVVVVSDHGEALGEHGLFFAHDFTVYEELIRVLMLIAAPGLEPGVATGDAALVDVVPTVCALASLACPEDLDGLDLTVTDPITRTTFAASAPSRQRYARAPWLKVDGPAGRMTAARSGHLKVLRIPTPAGPRWEAYDLADDPAERKDIHPSDRHAGLSARLEAWIEEMREVREARAPREPNPPPDRRTRRELRALGYLD